MNTELDDEGRMPTQPLDAQRIDAFWRDFTGRLGALEELAPREFVEHANELLQAHAPGLALELEGNLKESGSRLVVTAHGNIDQFENAQALARRAPGFGKDGACTVQAFRSRSLGRDFAMRMDGFELSCSDVLIGHYDAGGIVGLEISFEKIIPQDMVEHARHMSFIMLDHVLGEWDLAVRVGPVEFVDAFSEAVAGAEPLSVFPPIFDAFVRDDLGRSYELPQESDDRWSMITLKADDAQDDDPPDLLMFRFSANAVATRADLSWFLEWRMPIGDEERLERIRDAQQALGDELERRRCGLLVYTCVEAMQNRVAAFYVEDAAEALRLAREYGERHVPELEPDLRVKFDPSWQEYLDLYCAVGQGADGGGDGE